MSAEPLISDLSSSPPTTWERILACIGKGKPSPRTIHIGSRGPAGKKYTTNAVTNTKYNVVTFVPRVLYEQFRFFFNMYFLLLALSQVFPPLQIGFLFAYVTPLVFVLSITMIKEAYDDIKRWRADREVNSAKYTRVDANGVTSEVTSADLRVGDVLQIHQDQRVPADCLVLGTTEPSNALYIRTDQLDGETDWKVRIVHPVIARIPSKDLFARGRVTCGPPSMYIYEYHGRFWLDGSDADVAGLSLDHTAWAGTVVATGTMTALVLYTGADTRSQMNSSEAPSKAGLVDYEINALAEVLFLLMIIMAVGFAAAQQFRGGAVGTIITVLRYILLFSAMIPISMRVNIDVARAVYCWLIVRDKRLPGAVVRNSNLPEELGRLSFLFSDKTGTLTRNEMVFRRLCLSPSLMLPFDHPAIPTVLWDHFNWLSHGKAKATPLPRIRTESEGPLMQGSLEAEMSSNIGSCTEAASDILLRPDEPPAVEDTDSDDDDRRPLTSPKTSSSVPITPVRIDTLASSLSAVAARHAVDAMLAVVTCHNVTPGASSGQGPHKVYEYRADSPDDVAMIKYAASVGVMLVERTQKSLTFLCGGVLETYNSLLDFPFTSESRRMGIVVENARTGAISIVVKGSDDRMSKLCTRPYTASLGLVGQAAPKDVDVPDLGTTSSVQPSTVIHEQARGLALSGLRTLVYGSKPIAREEWDTWRSQYDAAKAIEDHAASDAKCYQLREKLESSLMLVALTGVEDRLQTDVGSTLATLRAAGVRVWMLTGDKTETAKGIAQSSELAARTQEPFEIKGHDLAQQLRDLGDRIEASAQLSSAPYMVVEGATVAAMLDSDEDLSDPSAEIAARATLQSDPLAARTPTLVTAFAPKARSVARRVTAPVRTALLAILSYVLPPNVYHSLTRRKHADRSLRDIFLRVSTMSPSVVVSRCSPKQKAALVSAIADYLPSERVAAVGDGGNDVGMIRAAHVGFGIFGKEGMKAALAADFALTEFCHIRWLLLWHGRNSYRRSSKLAQVILQRGVVISFLQALFSAIYYTVSTPLFAGWLTVGYSTTFTVLPVFALIMSADLSVDDANIPEAFGVLLKGRNLNFRSFLQWLIIAAWQAGIIFFGTLTALAPPPTPFLQIVSLSYMILCTSELFICAMVMRSWNPIFWVTVVLSLAFMAISVPTLSASEPPLYDKSYLAQGRFYAAYVKLSFS